MTAPERQAGVIVVGAGEAAAKCRAALLAAGQAVTAVRSADDAVRRAAEPGGPRVVALELQSPLYDGMITLAALRARAPDAPVVALARAGSLNRARAAMEAGAFDYITLPGAESLVAPVLAGALEAARRPPGPEEERALIAAAPALGGSSRAAVETRAKAARLARASAPLLVTGERGTGKGPAAAAMHALSGLPDRRLERLRCVMRDPEDLAGDLDAAQRRWRGVQGAAASPEPGATLLLEMACTLPPGLQSRVLRLLDAAALAGEAPDGAPRLRLMCSSRDDLEQQVADGRFRETLYHRLSVARLDLPPLRERGEDAAELAETHLAAEAPGFRGLHPELRRALLDHPWPRNCAQLLRTVEALAARLEDGRATPAGLPDEFLQTRGRPRAPQARRAARREAAAAQGAAAEDGASADPASISARVAPLVGLPLAQVEAALVDATLARCAGSVAEAAKILGLSPATLYRRRASRDARVARADGARDAGPAEAPAPRRES